MDEETYAIVTTGGPWPGVHYTGSEQYPWPLPGFLHTKHGSYVKMYDTDSLVADEDPSIRFPEVKFDIRAAVYRWSPGAVN